MKRLICLLSGILIETTTAQPTWKFENNLSGSQLGWSVSTAGDVNKDGYDDVISGAWLAPHGGEVYLHYGSAKGLSDKYDWKVQGDSTGARLGTSLSSGDFNGDGYGDIVMGASADKGRGGVYVYYGSDSGLADFANWKKNGSQLGAQLGWSVANAGDVNGDGMDDLIVSAIAFTGGKNREGRVYLYIGSKTGLADTAVWTHDGGQAGASFGRSISTAGDVNKDGFEDVLIGASGMAGGGSAYVFHGTPTGLAQSPAWTGNSEQDGSQYGWYVSEAGDVNADGYSDIMVGAYAFGNGQSSEGKTYLYLGSASGLSKAANWSDEGDQADALFGVSVSSGGDINRDGFSDVMISAEGHSNGQSKEGRVYIYFGSAKGLSVNPDTLFELNSANAYLGANVSQAGDVNGDKLSDLIIGAYRYSNGQSEEGAAVLYQGWRTKTTKIYQPPHFISMVNLSRTSLRQFRPDGRRVKVDSPLRSFLREFKPVF